ncbi:hypothetical protein J2Z23_002852 [Lederbergia galactosidilyticus]|nr:hypothetical protein [Lederbergia galactosidilytica]
MGFLTKLWAFQQSNGGLLGDGELFLRDGVLCMGTARSLCFYKVFK